MNLLKKLEDRRQLHRDYEATFGTPHGKRVLSHLFREAGITTPRMSLDTQEIIHDKGMQRIVWSIYRMANAKMDLDEEIDKLTKEKETQ